MFCVASDFDLEPYNIPNLNGNNSFAPYVNVKEELALRGVLGNVLYDQFVAGLATLPAVFVLATDYAIDAQVYYGTDIWKSLVNPNVGHIPVEGAYWTLVEASNKWLRLREGGNYSTSKRWVGMKKLLVPFIYFHWVGDAYDTNTGIGVVKAKGENSTVITPKRRVVRAFNEFAQMAGDSRWNGWSYVYNTSNTLYGFVSADSDLYPDFVYTYPGRMNLFNL